MHKQIETEERNPLNFILPELSSEENDIGKYFSSDYNYDTNKLSTIIFNNEEKILNEEGKIYFNSKTNKKNKNINKIVSKDENYLIFKRRKKEKYKFYFFEYDEKYNVIIHFSCLYIKEKNSELWSWQNIKARGVITIAGNYYYHYYDEHECDIFPIVNINYYDAKSDTYMKKKVFHSETQNIFNKCFGNGYTNEYLKNDNFDFIQNINFFVLSKDYTFFEKINCGVGSDYNYKDFSINAKNKILYIINHYISANYINYGKNSKFTIKNNNYHNFLLNNYCCNFSIIETIKEGFAVIRMFSMSLKNNRLYFEKDSFIFEDLLFFEYARVFVSEHDLILKRNINIGWESMSINNFYFEEISNVIIDIDDAAIKETRFKYFKLFLEKNNELFFKISSEINNTDINIFDENKKLFNKIFHMLQSPLVESLLKLDIDFFINEKSERIYTHLRNSFGSCDINEPDIKKAIGCPLYMVKYISEHENKKEMISFIKFLKYILRENPEYLKVMDKKVFENLAKEYVFFKRFFDYNNFINFQIMLKQIISITGVNNILKKILHLKKIAFLAEKEDCIDTTFILYKDYIKMLSDVIYVFNNSFKWKLNTLDEIRRMHDDILRVYLYISENKYELLNDSFLKQKATWDKYIFNKDDFSIIIPELPKDIVAEGESLHHCVKSYLDDIVGGITTILFIRKKENLEKSFFTIEIRDNEIRQCHGFSNCNTNTIPGLDNFIKEFCEEKDIIYKEGAAILAAH